MTAPTHYTGSDGEIQIGGDTATLVNFTIDMAVGVINSARIGKRSDMKYAGKFDVTGSITQVLVTGDLLAKLIGANADITTGSVESLLNDGDISGDVRKELSITHNPTNPTNVKATVSVDTANLTGGSIVIHGTDALGSYVTEVLDFEAMTVGDAPQVKVGSQVFGTTTYVDVEAGLTAGAAPLLNLDGVDGTKTITPGEPELFSIVGKVTDGTNFFQMTANDCFFTAGNFPIGDAETLVQTDLPFVMQDPDSGLILEWLAV